MALRLLEIISASSHTDRIGEILTEAGAKESWRVPLDDERTQTRALIPMGQVEGVLDTLDSRFGNGDGFRVLVVAIEASLPEPKKEKPSDSESESNGGMLRVSRQELYEDLEAACVPTKIYFAMVVLSTVVAVFGLSRDNVAVIIGAMVIAPLLGPNAALALATTLGDLKLAWISIISNVSGVTTALLVSLCVGLVAPIDTTAHEIVSRTTVGLGDIVLALAAGCAGSLAFTTGVSNMLVGVMVAVALLPPLAAGGILLGAAEWTKAAGAFTLLATNVICVNLSSVGTFLAMGIRPNTWWESKRAKMAISVSLVVWTVLLALLAVLVYFAFRSE